MKKEPKGRIEIEGKKKIVWKKQGGGEKMPVKMRGRKRKGEEGRVRESDRG